MFFNFCRAADWNLAAPDWNGRMRLVAKGKECVLKLEDKASGELFAKCPIDQYPGIAIESVSDSSRYFVLRIQDDSGRAAFIGVGFADRSDSFDLNVALQDHFKWLKQTEDITQVKVNPDLSNDQMNEIKSLLQEFKEIFTDLPGCTDVETHKIELLKEEPIKIKPYKLPFESEKVIEQEVKSLLSMDIIQASVSPYCAPLVLVKKKDGIWRTCVDFRKHNEQTIGDATPINEAEVLFTKLKDSKYFTKIDLSKGYFQIKMDDESRKYTAFATSLGLFEFKRMPFGLKNAPAF